jgi:hypothetical protein
MNEVTWKGCVKGSRGNKVNDTFYLPKKKKCYIITNDINAFNEWLQYKIFATKQIYSYRIDV